MSRSQIVLMVAALIASVIAFQLNATMLIPAIRTINEELGRGVARRSAVRVRLSQHPGHVESLAPVHLSSGT